MNTKALKKEILKSIIKDTLFILAGFMIIAVCTYFVAKDIFLPEIIVLSIVGFIMIFKAFDLYFDGLGEINTRLHIKELIDKNIPLGVELCDSLEKCIAIKYFAVDEDEPKLRINYLYSYGSLLSITIRLMEDNNKKIEIDDDLNVYVYLKL